MAYSPLPAVGVYPNLVNATSAGAKTEIVGHIEILRALFNVDPQVNRGGGVYGTTNALPYFDQIHPQALAQIHAELTALEASVTGGA